MSRYRLVISLGGLLLIGVQALLPFLDRYAFERDPWHPHLVIGARDPRQYVQALAHHDHGEEAGGSTTGSQGEIQVYSLSSQLEVRASASGLETQAVFLASGPPVMAQSVLLWLAIWPTAPSQAEIDLPNATPPPRSAA